MTIQFPMLVLFSVVRASMSSDIEIRDGLPCSISSLNLVLVAERDTKIHLLGGEPLSAVELHFSISSKWRTPTELDRDLTANEVGFLCHTRESNGKAFVHGAAIWPNEPLPQYLLVEDLRRNAQLTIASLPTIVESAPPHSWGTNREHVLRLSSVRFSALQGEG
jgi:hypothetical protein